MAADPYADFSAPVQGDDPYADFASRVKDEDPYAGFAAPVEGDDPYAEFAARVDDTREPIPAPETVPVEDPVRPDGSFAPFLNTVRRSPEAQTLANLADPAFRDAVGMDGGRDYSPVKDFGLSVVEGAKELGNAVKELPKSLAGAGSFMAGDVVSGSREVRRVVPMGTPLPNSGEWELLVSGDRNSPYPQDQVDTWIRRELKPEEDTGALLRTSGAALVNEVQQAAGERAAVRAEAYPEYFGGRFRDNPSLARAVTGAAPSVPGMALAVFNPILGSALMTAQESAPNYVEMRQAGFGPEDAAVYTGLHAVGTFALEKLPFDVRLPKAKLAKAIGGPAAVGLAIALQASTEAGTEMLQEGWQYATSKGFEGSLKDFKKDVDLLQVAASSALMGAGVSTAQQAIEAVGRNRGTGDGGRETGDRPSTGSGSSRGQVSWEADGAGGFRRVTTLRSDPALVGEVGDVGGQGTGDGGQGTGVGEQGTGVGGQGTGVGGQGTEDGGQGTEDGGQGTGVGGRQSIPVVVPESGSWVADTPKGERQVSGSWRVLDAAEVVSSDMEGFDQALQPRNRRSVGSAVQVDEIARNLNPNRLLDSPTTDDGAPVVTADNQVISGNGRMMALRAAYGMGTAEGYREAVAAQAAALGLDVSGMQAPVLVRSLDPGTVNLGELAELSNRPKVLERSAAEMAQADAALLTPDLLAVLDMEKPLTEKGNPEFFGQFVGAANDASLLRADGSIDPEAARKRVGNAIVASLAAGHPQAREVIGTLTEQGEALGLSKQLEAVSRAAPALIRTGALKPEYDLRGAFGKALNELVQFAKANAERKANNLKPISMRDWTGQLDIFSPRDNVADELSRVLMSVDPGAVRGILDRYAELAGNVDTSTVDMFGEANASALELLQRAVAEVEVPVPSGAEVKSAKRRASRNAAANVEPGDGSQVTGNGGRGPVSGSRNASATVGDITGAGWPGGDIAPAFRVELPAVPDLERAGSVRPLSEYMGRPLQLPLEVLLNRLEGNPEGDAVALSTVPPSPGVRVEVDPFLLSGAVDTSVGWESAWEQGAARFLAEVSNDTLRRAVRSISLPAGEFEKVKDTLQPLIRDWDGYVAENGNVVMSRPGHTRQILELPELVELAQEMGNGALPKVIGRLGSANWLGVFRHGVPGQESISLRADIFQLVTPAEIERLRTQADVYAAKLQEADPAVSDKERQQIARDRHAVLIEEAKAEARRNNPRLASKVLAHEIGHWVDHMPDALINARGNILGRLGVLTKFLKAELSLVPDQSPGLTKLDRNKLRADARKRVREQGGRPKDPDFNQKVNAKFAELRELRRRESGLVSKEDIQGELRDFIAWWRGTEKMEEYFEQPKEMYAEAISGYILNPAELGRRAPKTYALIESYIHKKPAIKKMWDRTQAEILSGQVQKNRVLRTREMFEEGNRVDSVVGRAREVTSRENVDAVIRTVDRKYGPIYRRAEKWANAKAGELVEAIARYRYRSNQHERYVQDVNSLVLQELVDHNLEWSDLEEYMLHYRILNEREDLANPLGWNPATSQDRLTEWRRDIGEERFARLEGARQAMRRLYEEHVLTPLENSGALDPDLMAYLKSNEAYATFVTHKGEQDALDQALSGRYGNQVTSHVYKQVGTLQKIHGPATKTMEKGIQIIDMAMRNRGIEGMVEMLREINTGEITPAEMKWDGRKRSPVVVNNEKLKTIMYLKNGEVQAYNVPKALADAWESAPSTEMNMLRAVNEIFSQRMKALFTGWNYGIWPVLWMRDVQDFKRRMPRRGKLPLQGPVYWRLMFGALKDASSMATSSPTPAAREAMNRGLTVSSVNFRGIWGEEQALNRLMKKYHQTPAARAEDQKAGMTIRKAWNKYIEMGQVLERTSKIAGMKYMDKYFPDMPEYQRNQKVRMFAGSQDFLDTPTLLPVIDLFQMFYNPWKQGWRSEIQSFKQHGPAMYAYTNFKYSVLPTVLKWAIWAGVATEALSLLTGGDEEEAKEIERQMKSVSEYDMMASHVIPVGWANRDERTAVYMRFPMSESQRLIGATTWKLLRALTEDGESGQPVGQSLRQAVGYAGDQLPAGNPIYNIGKAISDYYITGRNPVDARTGYNIIPETEFAAGGLEASESLGKYAWNNLGGTVLHRFELFEPDRELSDFEKFLKMPVISNTIGRFLRVSNRGLYDSVKPIRDQEVKTRARTRLDIEEALKNEEPFIPVDQYGAETLRRELRTKALDSTTNLEQKILEGVTGDEAKAKALERLRAIMD